MKVTAYTLEQRSAWTAALSRFPPESTDVYYTPEYLRTWVDHEGACARCLSIVQGDTAFLYPFLIKPVPDTDADAGYFDIFSAYGYGGMIANRPMARIDPDVQRDVNAAVDAWCRDNRVIAEFIRENPIQAVDGKYLRTAEHVRVRQNVYARVSDSYRLPSRSARRNVSLARRNGLTVQWDPDMAAMDRFAELYAATASHGDWDAYYHFDADYFRSVAEQLRGVGAIVQIRRDDDLVAAAIVFFCGRFATYHLSGSLPEARGDRPNDLMIEAILAEAHRRDVRIVSLGGGMSMSPEDPLFAFKQRFGDRIRDVHVGKRVHDSETYARICEQWETRHPDLADAYRHYLLKYRMGATC